MATTITVTEDVTEVTVTETTTQLNITPQVTTVGVSAVDITAANIAQSISLTPTGNISATNVQSAFAEIGANEDFTTTLKTKLDGIEELATADQTGSEIKTAYEAEADTNAFTNAEKTKLSNIEASATADQTDAEIKTAYESNANTNAFTDDDSEKLNAIEALADVTDTVNVTSAGAVMDSDFTSNGFMKRTDAGAYTVDSNTYLTDYTVTESDVTTHQSAIQITQSQITDVASTIERRVEVFRPITNSDEIQALFHPKITVPNDDEKTIAEFRLYGDSDTKFQELDLALNGKILNSHEVTSITQYELSKTILHILVQRKSKGATGTNIGTVAVADASPSQLASSGTHYWKFIKVAGDVTNKIDYFSGISTTSTGTNKKRIVSANYNPSSNQTLVCYDNQSTGAGIFPNTGATVYVSASMFEAAGQYVTAVPYHFDDSNGAIYEATFDLTEHVTPSTGNLTTPASQHRKTYNLPKVRLVADSGGAGDIDIKVIAAVRGSSFAGNANGTFDFYLLQVDQANIKG